MNSINWLVFVMQADWALCEVRNESLLLVLAKCKNGLRWKISEEYNALKLHFDHKYRVFQKDLNIFYSGHRSHRTWHPVIFSYGDTLKTMPTNHKLQDRIRAAVQTTEGEQVS